MASVSTKASKSDDALTALVKKCTTPTPESAARGKAEEVESLEAVTLLPESAAKRDEEEVESRSAKPRNRTELSPPR